MGEGKPVRDRSFKFPVSVDARKNPRIWDEAIHKEQKFFWNNKTPAQAAAERLDVTRYLLGLSGAEPNEGAPA